MSNIPAFRCDRCGRTIVGQKARRIALLDRDYCDECADRFEAFLAGSNDLADIDAVAAFLRAQILASPEVTDGVASSPR